MTSKNLKTGILSHFFIALVLDGLQRLIGLFMLELLQFVNVNRQNAALPFTASWAVANIVASFSGILIPSAKSEYAILLGVLLAAIGAALCIFTANITTLTVLWGFVFGSGYGLSSPHLSRYLKAANPTSSLLQATPNLGAAIMPFIFHILISYYGLQSSYLIFSGIILNYLPLSLAAAYSIELPIPNIKWRVRKRSNRYFVSKQDGAKNIFNESFINSLEPDLILTISQNDVYQDDMKSDSNSSEELLKEIVPVNRKRSETRGNDLQSLPISMRVLTPSRTHSQIITEIKSYERGRSVFEGSFGNDNVVYEDDVSVEENKSNELQEGSNGYKICYSERELEMNDINTKTESTIEKDHTVEQLKLELSEKSYEGETKISTSKKQESASISSEKHTEISSSTKMQTNTAPGNEILLSVIQNKDEGHTEVEEELNKQNNETSVTEDHPNKLVNRKESHGKVEVGLERQTDKILFSEKHSEKIENKDKSHGLVEEALEKQNEKILVSGEHFEKLENKEESRDVVEEQLEKQNYRISLLQGDTENFANNTAAEEALKKQNEKAISVANEYYEKSSCLLNSPINENLKPRTKNLDSRIVINIPMDIKVHVVECLMTDEEYHKVNWKNNIANWKKKSYREHSNSMIPGMYDNIDFTQLNFSKKNVKPENSKLASIYTISENSKFDEKSRALKPKENEQNCANYTISKIKPVFKVLAEMTTPVCLCIILITIIFEFNIVTLLTIFADFGKDIEDDCADFKCILVFFGFGGLVGKICCCKISRTIPEKSHTIGVILFLLTGLSTAGILFSPNLYWLAGFYCILGALEGGITYTIPKFILEHIDKKLHSKLSSVKIFLSGIAVASIPYAIGLSRDDLDDYEFLLQILSCSSVFCAFLAYFLPHLSRTFK